MFLFIALQSWNEYHFGAIIFLPPDEKKQVNGIILSFINDFNGSHKVHDILKL